jgi:hypothetical protein
MRAERACRPCRQNSDASFSSSGCSSPAWLLAVFGFRLPFGNLPGDIRIEGERGSIFVPLATMVVVSIILTIVLNLVVRR